MRFILPTEPLALAAYLPKFMELFGADLWAKRANQLANDMERSPYLYKIVFDYHWLEMNICHQWQVFVQESRVDLGLIPELHLASLNFAATAVEVHRRLGKKGKRVLSGRVFDSLKAENGFAALYLELSLVQRLQVWGFDTQLPDMEGSAQFDILISREGFWAEVECKSQSADAGRQIHRKHFYRFMTLLQPSDYERLGRTGFDEIVVVTLSARLSADLAQQALLAEAVTALVGSDETLSIKGSGFELIKHHLENVPGIEQRPQDHTVLQAALNKAFGHNLHLATWEVSNKAYLLVMRSKKEDDPSWVTLESMRKGANQLTKTRPGFLAIQEHGMQSKELFLPQVQRRMRILSDALFGHYKAHHVNAVYVTGYGAVEDHHHTLHTPGFATLNMLARHKIPPGPAEALLNGLLQGRPPARSATP